MPRIFLQLSFNGSAFHGWQTQALGLRTVQATLEACLKSLAGTRTAVIGCGRTDTGVHASCYYAHTELSEKLLGQDFLSKITDLLPTDLRIHDWWDVPADAHAQKDALWRKYLYRIGLSHAATASPEVGRYQHLHLDIERMQKAVSLYASADDFRAFCRKPHQYPSTLCRIDSCELSWYEELGELRFEVQANRFLHNMVRLLVARMIEVGHGGLSLDELESALWTGQALRHQRPAYANGLSLINVGYPKKLKLVRSRQNFTRSD